jgi:hypothetical protein
MPIKVNAEMASRPKVKTLDNSRLAEGNALAVLSHLIEGYILRL